MNIFQNVNVEKFNLLFRDFSRISFKIFIIDFFNKKLKSYFLIFVHGNHEITKNKTFIPSLDFVT